MFPAKKDLVFAVILGVVASHAHAQKAVAVSSNPGPGLHIALNWSPYSGAAKYNIFRKPSADASYPSSPLNSSPLVPVSNCATVRTILITSPDSTDWKIVQNGLADSTAKFNPCNISTISRTSEKYRRLQMLCKGSMPIAIVAGLGYEDNTVTSGKTYKYRIVALNASNTILGNVAIDLEVTAGSFVLPPAPTGVAAEPGDALNLVRWDSVAGAAGFILERGLTGAGPFTRVNESVFATKINNHLNGTVLTPPSPGMIDFKRYTVVNGKDSTHTVNGIPVEGPKNNIDYYYRVRSIDLFKRPGGPSSVVGPVTPRDSTAPSTPIDLAASADDITGNVTVRWTQVVKDRNGHWEYPDSTVRYKLYRFPSSENPDSVPYNYIGQTVTLHGLKSRDTTDTDPSLRSTYGNKTWWYRLKAIDANNNVSQWSSAVSAIVKDITPPAIVRNLVTKGFETYISVKWKPNTEPDMASYMIYRSLCHLGSWIDCDKQKDTCNTWQNYDPSKAEKPEGMPVTEGISSVTTGGTRNRMPCPCSGPFVFLGEITQDSVHRAVSAGHFFFDDRTIPAGSPLCYAYWIKAKDSSGNLSGTFPIPSPAEKLEIKCERLHDLTPPEPALISGLFAQAEQVRVEWMGPPTQDTRAYHVYRAEGTDPRTEPPPAAYHWVGGMTVELPPTLPKVLASPYVPPGIATCDKISVQATPWMSQGYFEDKSIKPKLTYWYKVVGIDYDGNETPLTKAAAISTFSFTRRIPDAPVITSITTQADPCAIVLQWSPVIDTTTEIGFIVFRSGSGAGPFTPVVVSPVKDNIYTDINVVKGQTYWYRVGLLMKNGRLSALSAIRNITP